MAGQGVGAYEQRSPHVPSDVRQRKTVNELGHRCSGQLCGHDIVKPTGKSLMMIRVKMLYGDLDGLLLWLLSLVTLHVRMGCCALYTDM